MRIEKMTRIRAKNKRLVIVLFSFGVFLLSVYLLYSFLSDNPQSNTQLNHTEDRPTILFWTKVFNKEPNLKDYCPADCILTTNRSTLNEASAVVFHAHDIDQEKHLPKPVNRQQKFVFISQEALPSLNLISKDKWWKEVLDFHWVISFVTKAHVRMPYGGYFVEPTKGRERKFKPIGNFNKDQILATKQINGAIWFVSNCDSQERMDVALALKKHFRVDIGGKCSPDNKNLCPHGQDCNPLINQYYFYLAFENENCVDYVTEKMTELLTKPVVPIVMKRSVYNNILPPEAFIAVDDFSSAQKLAEHLTFLIAHPDDYFKLFKWRNEWTRADWNSEGYSIGLCALCDKLHHEKDTVVEPIPNLKRWYEENSKCEKAVQSSWYN